MSDKTVLEKATPCAEWTPDCQGKWDYDGRLISISCRYWPRGGGFSISDGNGSFETNADQSVNPSAKASIVLNFGQPGDYLDLESQEFTAETEQEVKSKVEQWVANKFQIFAAYEESAATIRSLMTELDEARSHVAVAISQSLPSDDQIIMGHLRSAKEILDAALAQARRSK